MFHSLGGQVSDYQIPRSTLEGSEEGRVSADEHGQSLSMAYVLNHGICKDTEPKPAHILKNLSIMHDDIFLSAGGTQGVNRDELS